ncbi:MAG: cobalt ECF transporter T component CbiQ [Lachnospiraceae bacterium]|nr:cobalt ECF transporter T component CbiQ [Lachnospiraceae bacterium]
MNRLQKAVKDIHTVDAKEAGRKGQSKVHPLSRLAVTVLYILLTVSFPKYDLGGIGAMVVYLLITGIWEEISFREALGRIWPVLLLAGAVGIANPFVDRKVCWESGSLAVTYGMVSMVTLMLKGIFSVMASYLLIMTVGMEGICSSLRVLHVPKEFVTILLLMHRYLIVLLKEAERMMQAYRLRAPGQKGIHVNAWGAFAGQLLLRSVDRAQTVYESMLLRGYTGEIIGKRPVGKRGISIGYAVSWTLVLAGIRILPVFQMVGSLF